MFLFSAPLCVLSYMHFNVISVCIQGLYVGICVTTECYLVGARGIAEADVIVFRGS